MTCDKCSRQGAVVDMAPGTTRSVVLCEEHRREYEPWHAWNGRERDDVSDAP